jgi:tripartite-type tricarboxylate transporter receptor subunit TctC
VPWGEGLGKGDLGRLEGTLVHVPYKGEGQALIDVIAGNLPMMFSNPTAAMARVQAGKLRALAVTGPEHSPAVPGIPTMPESGLSGFEVVGFFGVVAPAGMPREIVALLNGEIAKVLARPDIKERFASQALDPANKTPEQFSEYIRSEVIRRGKLIQEAGIRWRSTRRTAWITSNAEISCAARRSARSRSRSAARKSC